MAVRLRRGRPDLIRGGLFRLISSHMHPGAEVPLEQRLLLGIEYADGRRASTLQDARMAGPGAEPDGQQLVLTQQGGGGRDDSVDGRYGLPPLPPGGPVPFVLAWPGFGIAESRTEVDGAAIRAAADRSQLLGPLEPAVEPPPLPPPPRPSSGWF